MHPAWKIGMALALTFAAGFALGLRFGSSDGQAPPTPPNDETAEADGSQARIPWEREEIDIPAAGVIPRSQPAVTAVPPPASRDDAEQRTLEAVGKICPDLLTPDRILQLSGDEILMAELGQLYDETASTVHRAREVQGEIAIEIFRQRLEAGQYVESVSREGWIDATQGEIIQSSVSWDPVRKQDIRKIVRIYPGESFELDEARNMLRYQEDRQRQTLETFLLARIR